MIVKPTFFCVGARKTGTSWLYHYFEERPDVLTPIVKELNFFNAMEQLWSEELDKTTRGAEVAKLVNFHKKGNGKRFRSFPERFPRTYSSMSVADMVQWYEGYFSADLDTISEVAVPSASCDISPLYQNLSLTQIQRLQSYYPSAKIIYILRDPAERLWSDFVMVSRSKQELDKLRSEDELAILRRLLTYSLRGSIYTSIIGKWKKVFGSQFQVFFYEELKENPRSFIGKILELLELPKDDNLALKISNPNPNKQQSMPPFVADLLGRVFESEKAAIMAQFPQEPWPKRWH